MLPSLFLIFGFSTLTIMPATNKDSYFCSFPICLFLYFISLTSTFGIILNSSGHKRHPCFALDVIGKLSPLSMMLVVGFLYIFLTELKNLPFILSLLRVFFIINGFWTMSKNFSVSINIHLIFLL